MAEDLVIRRDDGPVATLSLNRPGLYNAWGMDMADQLVDMLRALDGDPVIKACILTGEGDKAFCSGANLQDESTHMIPSVEEHLGSMRVWSQPNFFHDILGFRKPLVCAVNGYAVGAGFLVPICCDVILASTNAKFKMPQTSLGILPAYGGTARLAQWIGRGRAMEIALSGRTVAADEAERIGLVSRVVEPSELLPAAQEFAAAVASQPELAVALTKESALLAMEQGSLQDASTMDLYRFTALSLTADTRERHEAWRAERDQRRSAAAPTE